MEPVKKPRRKKKTRIGRAYSKISREVAKDLRSAFNESLWVMPKVLQEYSPPDDVVKITEYMLSSGETDPAQVCYILDINQERYIKLLRSPRNIAWMSAVFTRHIPYLIGRLDMVMYHKALSGSVPAYRAVIERFNLGGIHKSVSVSVETSTGDLSELSTEQLEKLIEDKTRKAGINEPERPGSASGGSEGAGETQTQRPTALLQAPPEADGVPRGGEDIPPADGPGG